MSPADRTAPRKDERRERLAQVQGVQQRAERRRNLIILAISVAVALALIIPTLVLVIGAQRRAADIEDAANDPIEGVTEYADLEATHVSTDVEYEQNPPVGGDHNPVWQNCGFYGEPVQDENAVHSLEHGAVWLAYSPDLPEADVAELREMTDRYPYLLVSPYEGLDGPVVASAWGVQLALDSVDDERLQVFIRKYLQGPQTPEPGAACTGGTGA